MERIRNHLPVISRCTLKILAFVTMVVDHIGAIWLMPGTLEYTVCRLWIGRLAYPIFCVLFVESFFYIRPEKRFRHLVMLLVTALVSVIPYAMTLHPGFDQMNIFWSWTFVFLMFWIFVLLDDSKVFTPAVSNWIKWGVTVVFGLLSQYVFHFEYGLALILAAGTCYIFRQMFQGIPSWALCLIVCIYEFLAYPSSYGIWFTIPLFFLYDGKKQGKRLRYLYYVGYPLHLFVFGLLLRFFL